MVAAFSVYYDFGGTDGSPGTEQDIDALGPPTLRFKRADNATIDANDPIPIPTDGSTNYSRWKQIYLYCDTAPDTQVNNVKFYSDGGGFGTGVSLYVGDEMPTKTNAANTGYQVADVNATMVGGHTDIAGQTSVFTYTSGSPKSVTIGEAGGIINAIGETTNYLVCQMAVTSAASPGNLADETLTFQYDEI